MAEENKINSELDSMLKELHNMLENSGELDYSDIMNEMAVTYKAISIANEESNMEAAQELQGYLKKFNDLAKTKKPEIKPKTQQIKKEIDSRGNILTSKIDEVGTNRNDIKEIPEPIKTSDQDVPNVADAEVKQAVNSSENTKEEVYAEFEKALAEQKNKVQEVKPIRNPIPASTEFKEIPAPVIESSKPNIENIESARVEEKKEDIILDTPTVEENIIVSNSEDKPQELTEEEKKQQEDYQKIVDMLTPKPFDGDDDIMEDKKEEATKEEVPAIATKEEVDAEKIKAIEEEYSKVPDDIELYNVKSISRKKVSDTLKALSKLNTKNIDIQKLEMFDLDTADTNIRRDYLKTRNDMISAPRISRVALLMSGHYEEISAYGNYDLISVERTLYNDQASFVDRERTLYESIYEHVKYVSYASEKPDFDTWAKNIMYPDISSLFFGVYDANSVGDNHYLFDCPFCSKEVSITTPNKNLLVGVPKELTKDKLEKFITNKDIMKLDSTDIAKWAKSSVVRKILPETSIIVDFAVPTLYDYLVTITTLDRINNRDMEGKLNLSIIDEFSDAENDIEDFNRIMAYLYIKDIGIPARMEGTNKFRYIKLSSKADIIEHINGLDESDYSELLKGEDVRNLIVKTATRYYLHDCKCNSCGRNVKYVSINPKQIFFFKIGEGRNKRMMG